MQVWEGEGVIKYGRKLIGATDPQKSEPGTIRGDLAVGVGRYHSQELSSIISPFWFSIVLICILL